MGDMPGGDPHEARPPFGLLRWGVVRVESDRDALDATRETENEW